MYDDEGRKKKDRRSVFLARCGAAYLRLETGDTPKRKRQKLKIVQKNRDRVRKDRKLTRKKKRERRKRV